MSEQEKRIIEAAKELYLASRRARVDYREAEIRLLDSVRELLQSSQSGSKSG